MNIVALPVDRGGCGWYRVRQPMQMIKMHTASDTYLYENDDDPNDLVRALTGAQVAIIRQGGEASINHFKEYPELRHLKFVLDIDDNIELINPLSEHYKEYGLRNYFYPHWEEADLPHGRLWWDGETKGFDLKFNRQRVMQLMVGMKQADLITVTTERLAEYARQFNPNVAVLPNFVDTAKWWKMAKCGEKKQLRVGWSGGMSHYEDWYTIRKPLNALMKKYQFKLVVVGSHFGGMIDDENKHLVEVHPWEAFEAHSYRMMALDIDMAIIPLADMAFNHYKSPIKLVEMAAMGIPSVVAHVSPYAEVEQGFYYSNEEQFSNQLEVLLASSKIRKETGDMSYRWAHQNWDAAKNAHLWVDAYSAIL